MTTANRGDSHNDSDPWSRRRDAGIVTSFIDSVIMIVQAPGDFFSRIDPTSSVTDSILFGVIVSTLSWLVGAFWQFGFQLLQLGFPSGEELAIQLVVSLAGLIGVVVLAPIGALIVMLLSAGISHVLIVIFGFSSRPFGATLKTIAYSQTAQIANLIPVCGAIIASVWQLVLTVIGFQKLHGMSIGQALLVIFTPLIVILSCVCLVIIFMVGAVGIGM